MRRALFPLLVIAVTAASAIVAAASYSGQQSRAIKSLAPEEIADLEAGRGMGLAKPAELNHYPGPLHVLELKERLALSAEQIHAVESSFARMSASAKAIGADVIARERLLDQRFADATMTVAALDDATAGIATLQGRLRAVHLAAHLETRAALTSEQIARYDELRGYASPAPATAPGEHSHQHR